MPRTAALLAAGLVAVAAAVPAGAPAQDLPADVDQSRLRPATGAGAVGSTAPGGSPSIASPVVRVRAGAVRIKLVCPVGGPACSGTLALHDLSTTGLAGRTRVAMDPGTYRNVGVRIARKRGRTSFVALATLAGTPIGGILVRK